MFGTVKFSGGAGITSQRILSSLISWAEKPFSIAFENNVLTLKSDKVGFGRIFDYFLSFFSETWNKNKIVVFHFQNFFFLQMIKCHKIRPNFP